MLSFVYKVADPNGIHARPAGLIAGTARMFPDTSITISKGKESAAAGRLMKLMSMGIRQGDEIVITADGGSEAEAIAAMKRCLEENL